MHYWSQNRKKKKVTLFIQFYSSRNTCSTCSLEHLLIFRTAKHSAIWNTEIFYDLCWMHKHLFYVWTIQSKIPINTVLFMNYFDFFIEKWNEQCFQCSQNFIYINEKKVIFKGVFFLEVKNYTPDLPMGNKFKKALSYRYTIWLEIDIEHCSISFLRQYSESSSQHFTKTLKIHYYLC